ncbi:hypothetical protein ACIQWA_06660 [Kitasatospora sp. NPDC098652]|uniref:hypothetical protein n=1 Tax=Kitasatospora sp. NPDC098652 TaxID=3364095 RepID=UPI0037F63B2B
MSSKRAVLAVAAAAAAAALAAGCSGSGGAPPPASTGGGSAAVAPTPGPAESNPAGDIPDNQAYVAYTPDGGGFTVKTPEGWSRSTTGQAVVFYDKLNRIEITAGTAPSAPTAESVAAQVVPALEKQVPKFTMGKVSTVSRAAGTAVLVTYQGDSAPDAVTGKVVRDAFEQYTFYQGGRQVVLTLSGPVGADNADPWRTVTDSFRWT